MTDNRCSVTDETGSCSRPAKARGLCSGHYQRWRAEGEPGPVALRRIRKGSEAVCSQPGCGKLHKAQGLCAAHYYRAKNNLDLDPPVHQQAPKLRLTDREMGLIADTSLPAHEVAKEVGLHATTISEHRRAMGLGVLRVSDWTDYEIDFLIENLSKMKTEKIAGYLNREVRAVYGEIARLRANGIGAKRTSKRLDPWIISGRPLIAKSCPDCGHFLPADWFAQNPTKSGKKRYTHNCRNCRYARKNKINASKDGWTDMQREYKAKVQAYTLERAENNGKEWTSVDVEVLADPNKTVLEKALELKRTYAATENAQQRHGFSAKQRPRGNPHDSAWRLFWEIEDLAVAS